jgi:rhodanese-related sulfurtransferase
MLHSGPLAPAKRTRRHAVWRLAAAMPAALIAFGALSPIAAPAQTLPSDRVSLEEARRAHEAGEALLIDIREPHEHARGVAAGARLLPMSQLARRAGEIPHDAGKPVLLICNTQNRSAATLRALRQHGYGHVRYVHGGMADWVRRGWPVVSPPPRPFN